MTRGATVILLKRTLLPRISALNYTMNIYIYLHGINLSLFINTLLTVVA
jgi:hypothetical protein